MQHALHLRQKLFNIPDSPTTGYRLFNGEGDGLPGLVCDVYGDTAVLQMDGDAPAAFWNPEGIASWLVEGSNVQNVFQRYRSRQQPQGRSLIGTPPHTPVSFLENGIHFTADLEKGQKTGFFLDQRQNRALIRTLAEEAHVLNLFGYTGGFSVYAGLGGAAHVTTVDTSSPALEAASHHWVLNGLPDSAHQSVASDAFDYLDTAVREGKSWDLVILDPPSFASSEQTVERALNAYQKLIAPGATLTRPGGLLAAASCSSHVSLEAFLEACIEAISNARRRGIVLGVYGQPPDHPAPLVMPELRYLKFVVLRVEQ
jgi:23S rRNA (cytosine1962-C5)-methyltransferase